MSLCCAVNSLYETYRSQLELMDLVCKPGYYLRTFLLGLESHPPYGILLFPNSSEMHNACGREEMTFPRAEDFQLGACLARIVNASRVLSPRKSGHSLFLQLHQ
jgi:hypothetical protein